MGRRIPPFEVEDAEAAGAFIVEDQMTAMENEISNSILRTVRHMYDLAHGRTIPVEMMQKCEAFNAREISSTEPKDPDPVFRIASYPSIMTLLKQIPEDQLNTYLEFAKKQLKTDVEIFYHRKGGYGLTMPYRHIPYFYSETDTPTKDEFYDAMLVAFHDTRAYEADAKLNQDDFSCKPKRLHHNDVCYREREYHFEDEATLIRYVNSILPLGIAFAEDGQKIGKGLN